MQPPTASVRIQERMDALLRITGMTEQDGQIGGTAYRAAANYLRAETTSRPSKPMAISSRLDGSGVETEEYTHEPWL